MERFGKRGFSLRYVNDNCIERGRFAVARVNNVCRRNACMGTIFRIVYLFICQNKIFVQAAELFNKMLIARCKEADLIRICIGGKVQIGLEANAGCAGNAHGDGIVKGKANGFAYLPSLAGDVGNAYGLTGRIGRCAVFPREDGIAVS